MIYLEEPASSEAIQRAVAYGGTVVASNNPYWDIGGVTIADPDGYRVVLTPAKLGPVTLQVAPWTSRGAVNLTMLIGLRAYTPDQPLSDPRTS